MHPRTWFGSSIVPSPLVEANRGKKVKDDRFLIITGLSGSGKTVVSRFLEDIGYYCSGYKGSWIFQKISRGFEDY